VRPAEILSQNTKFNSVKYSDVFWYLVVGQNSEVHPNPHSFGFGLSTPSRYLFIGNSISDYTEEEGNKRSSWHITGRLHGYRVGNYRMPFNPPYDNSAQEWRRIVLCRN
jgi:hypothetical protein